MNAAPTSELQWAHRYLMVEPNHFRVDYSINPFMHLDDQPEPLRTRREWLAIVAAIEAAGGKRRALRQRPDAPDMVYAMNLGLRSPASTALTRVVLSHMRFPSAGWRPPTADAWFAGHGFARPPSGGTAWGRTSRQATPSPSGRAGGGIRPAHRGARPQAPGHRARRRVRGLPDHPPRDVPLRPRRSARSTRAGRWSARPPSTTRRPRPAGPGAGPAGADRGGGADVLRQLHRRRPHGADARLPDRVRARLEAWGFEVVVVDVGEFHKGGGSIRCLTNPLDVASVATSVRSPAAGSCCPGGRG